MRILNGLSVEEKVDWRRGFSALPLSRAELGDGALESSRLDMFPVEKEWASGTHQNMSLLVWVRSLVLMFLTMRDLSQASVDRSTGARLLHLDSLPRTAVECKTSQDMDWSHSVRYLRVDASLKGVSVWERERWFHWPRRLSESRCRNLRL
jgi:hypothetical protein